MVSGSGKTTILSLICSDHPLSYSLPIEYFGRSRLPTPTQPGLSIFDIQSRIGHSSPEIHAFFPRKRTLRQVLENAWADTFLGKPVLSYQRDLVVDACLRWFRLELDPNADRQNMLNLITILPSWVKGSAINPRTPNEGKSKPTKLHRDGREEIAEYTSSDVDWADTLLFGELPFSAQRVALFLRALIKKPDIVILDEAFSGMDEVVREKCKVFLTYGETMNRLYLPGRKSAEYVLLPTHLARNQKAVIHGLEDRQALVCVSHVKEEVPNEVRNWICLPEAGQNNTVRFGLTISSGSWWDQVWQDA